MLPRPQRLTAFQEVYRSGRVIRGRYLSLRYIKRADGPARIGFAVPRLVKSKVMKNRLKRRLRAICRKQLDRLQGRLDIVVNIFACAAEASCVELEQDFVRVLELAGIIRKIRQEQI